MLAIFPDIANTAVQKDWERLAVQLRRYFGGPTATKPRIDVDSLIGFFGIPAAEIAIKDWGQIAARDCKGSIEVKMAIRQGIDCPLRRRFLQAHLLGHCLIHLQTGLAASAWEHRGYRERQDPVLRYEGSDATQNTSARSRVEDEADAFAASLLMPKAMFLHAHQKLQDTHKLATVFGVRLETAQKRLKDLDASMSAHPQTSPGAQNRGGSAQDSGKATLTIRSSSGNPSARPQGLDRIRQLARQMDPSVEK